MSHALTILLLVAIGLTVGVLLLGIVSMARGGEFNRRNANRLMRYRVAFQGLAVLIVILLLYVFKGG